MFRAIAISLTLSISLLLPAQAKYLYVVASSQMVLMVNLDDITKLPDNKVLAWFYAINSHPTVSHDVDGYEYELDCKNLTGKQTQWKRFAMSLVRKSKVYTDKPTVNYSKDPSMSRAIKHVCGIKRNDNFEINLDSMHEIRDFSQKLMRELSE